jgi:hypothetical protein
VFDIQEDEHITRAGRFVGPVDVVVTRTRMSIALSSIPVESFSADTLSKQASKKKKRKQCVSSGL